MAVDNLVIDGTASSVLRIAKNKTSQNLPKIFGIWYGRTVRFFTETLPPLMQKNDAGIACTFLICHLCAYSITQYVLTAPFIPFPDQESPPLNNAQAGPQENTHSSLKITQNKVIEEQTYEEYLLTLKNPPQDETKIVIRTLAHLTLQGIAFFSAYKLTNFSLGKKLSIVAGIFSGAILYNISMLVKKVARDRHLHLTLVSMVRKSHASNSERVVKRLEDSERVKRFRRQRARTRTSRKPLRVATPPFLQKDKTDIAVPGNQPTGNNEEYLSGIDDGYNTVIISKQTKIQQQRTGKLSREKTSKNSRGQFQTNRREDSSGQGEQTSDGSAAR